MKALTVAIFWLLLVSTGAHASLWKFDDSTDQIDDSRKLTAIQTTINADNKIGGIVIGCNVGFGTNVVVGDSVFFGTMPPLQVYLRVNKEKAVRQEWQPLDGGKFASMSGPEPKIVRYLQSLPNVGALFVRIYDFDSMPHDVTFALDGIDEVRSKIGAACKW